MLYIFQSYIVWGILNMFMYFQILEMEKQEKQELSAMQEAKQNNILLAKTRNPNVSFWEKI